MGYCPALSIQRFFHSGGRFLPIVIRGWRSRMYLHKAKTSACNEDQRGHDIKKHTAPANLIHSSTPLTNGSSAVGTTSWPQTTNSSNVACFSRILTGSSGSDSVSPSWMLWMPFLVGPLDGSRLSVGIATMPRGRIELSTIFLRPSR